VIRLSISLIRTCGATVLFTSYRTPKPPAAASGPPCGRSRTRLEFDAQLLGLTLHNPKAGVLPVRFDAPSTPDTAQGQPGQRCSPTPTLPPAVVRARHPTGRGGHGRRRKANRNATVGRSWSAVRAGTSQAGMSSRYSGHWYRRHRGHSVRTAYQNGYLPLLGRWYPGPRLPAIASDASGAAGTLRRPFRSGTIGIWSTRAGSS
jgi:hypothetical protein